MFDSPGLCIVHYVYDDSESEGTGGVGGKPEGEDKCESGGANGGENKGKGGGAGEGKGEYGDEGDSALGRGNDGVDGEARVRVMVMVRSG